ncbi:16508_t:CDS:2, partial [Racocetra fulgida]
SIELKYICEKFIQKEKEKCLNPPQILNDTIFGKFLDKPEKLQELTNQMLRVLTKRPDYMVIAQINNKEVEIGYLETGQVMSTISTSSAMSVDSSTTTVASPSHYSSSSKKRKSRNNKK